MTDWTNRPPTTDESLRDGLEIAEQLRERFRHDGWCARFDDEQQPCNCGAASDCQRDEQRPGDAERPADDEETTT